MSLSFNVPDDATNNGLTYGSFAARVDALLSAPMPSCLELPASPLLQEKDVNVNPHSSSESTAALRYKRLLHHYQQKSAPKEKGKPIYEVLLEKGEKARLRQEALVKERLAKEVSDLRAAPTLAPGSKLAVPREGERIEDKLMRKAKEHDTQWQKKVEERNRMKEEKMNATLVFKPSITRKGKGSTSKFWKAAEQYPEQCRLQRLEEVAKAQQQAEQEMQNVRPKPALAPHSEKLAASRRVKQGLDGMRAGDALFLLAQRKQDGHGYSAAGVNDSTFTPAITPHTAHASRTGNTCQRLYDMSMELEERRAYERERWREAHTPFTPQLTRLAYAVPSRYDVLRSPSTAEEDDREHEPFSFHPAIDPVSAAIARQLPDSVCDRLYRTAEVRDDAGTASDSQSFYSIPDAYRPSAMPAAMSKSMEAYESRRKERLAALSVQQEEERMRECTFAPRVNSTTLASGGPANVALRSDAWLRKREQKLEELRAAHEAESCVEHRDVQSPEAFAPSPRSANDGASSRRVRTAPQRAPTRGRGRVATYNSIYSDVYGI